MLNIKNFVARDAKVIQFLDLSKYQVLVTFYDGLFVVSYMHKLLDREPRHRVFRSEIDAINECHRIFNIVSQ